MKKFTKPRMNQEQRETALFVGFFAAAMGAVTALGIYAYKQEQKMLTEAHDRGDLVMRFGDNYVFIPTNVR